MEQCGSEFDLTRFILAQEQDFATALAEIRAGQKESHWMWYTFPQLTGLGFSVYAQYFGIPDLDAARAFLAHPYLRGNLLTISHALLELELSDPGFVMGFPDDQKLQSSMTLFELAAPEESVFAKVLDKFYQGERDSLTLALLQQRNEGAEK